MGAPTPLEKGWNGQLASREVKVLHDQATAIQIYYRQQQAELDIQNAAGELKLRTERRLGELLAGMDKRDGGDATRARLHRATEFPPRLSDLGIEKTNAHRWQIAATVPEDDFEQYLADTKAAQRELTSADILRLAKTAQRRPIEPPDEQTDIVRDLDSLIQRGSRFGTIYADPPWPYSNQGTRAATSRHYPSMSIEVLVDLPVNAIVATDAHLHLWTTNAFLFEAKRLIEAWGFVYKSMLLWVKPTIGIGNYWRVSHELLLLGVRGHCPFRDRSVRSWIEAPRGEHSAKPEEVRSLIERVSPPPYLELFGRRVTQGWTVFGNEIENASREAHLEPLESA